MTRRAGTLIDHNIGTPVTSIHLRISFDLGMMHDGERNNSPWHMDPVKPARRWPVRIQYRVNQRTTSGNVRTGCRAVSSLILGITIRLKLSNLRTKERKPAGKLVPSIKYSLWWWYFTW